MTFSNLLVGLPVMLLCLVAQVASLFWCVRYYVRQSTRDFHGRVSCPASAR